MRRQKKLTIDFILLCLVTFLSNSALAVMISPTIDTDKYSIYSELKLWYNDNDPTNGQHDAGEDWKSYNPGNWSHATQSDDNSCWMASATNMLTHELSYPQYETYYDLVDGQTIPETWDDVGYQWLVFKAYSVGYDRKIAPNYDNDCKWTIDPIAWSVGMLEANHPVGLGLRWVIDNPKGHAITLWGIDAEILSITDSDTFSSTSSYTYDGSYWTIDYKDYYGDVYNGYVDYVVAIPEPATVVLIGLGSLALLRRRRG